MPVPPLAVDHSGGCEEEEGKGQSNMELRTGAFCSSGDYKGFSQASVMECKFLLVQITLTDSGLPRAPPYENRRRYLGNRGNGFSKRTSCHFL